MSKKKEIRYVAKKYQRIAVQCENQTMAKMINLLEVAEIILVQMILTLCLAHAVLPSNNDNKTSFPCPSEIFCHGKLLDNIQMARIFNDSKSFVDMRMKQNPEQVMAAFGALGPKTTRDTLRKFVSDYFESPGKDLDPWIPVDWQEKSPFLEKIKDTNLKEFGSALNSLWKKLGRVISTDARTHPNRSSLIIVDKPFIVPGGRFREYYYWDTFWTVEGLLVCQMKQTVRHMIDNFAQLVKAYGFVPNGGRIYYLNRSQPPFFIPMVERYLTATDDFDYVKGILSTLEAEYNFWNSNRSIEIEMAGKMYRLNQYVADMNTPRPESYYEDVHTAGDKTEKEKPEVYQDLASAAESGWDFSSRWFKRSSKSLKTIRTRKLIPVDLNAVLYRNEKTLEMMFRRAGNSQKADHFKQLAEKRREAMMQVFWNEKQSAWLDYDLESKSSSPRFYASSVVPLWAGLHRNNVTQDKLVVDKLKELKVLDFPGGVPTSLSNSSQQWDFPNSWAPLQYMIMEGMANSKDKDIQKAALKLAQDWILTNYIAWKKTKRMFEKYDARVQGVPGGGGEYDIQVGFGWTNGVALHILKRYPNLQVPTSAPPSSMADLLASPIKILWAVFAIWHYLW